MAERRSLKFLAELCERVQKVHAPGVKIILCSDGRFFSDVNGISENDVRAYQQGLMEIITELSLTSISTFNLEDVLSASHFMQSKRAITII